MPLIRTQEPFFGSTKWFHSDCKTHQIDAGQTEWNLRHSLLAEDSFNAWISIEPTSDTWLGPDTLVTQQCGLFLDEPGVHSKTRHTFGSGEIASSNAKQHRALAIRVRADELRVEFEALSKRWQRDTRHLSLVAKKITHPAYFRIAGMGEAAIPLLLEALRDRPAHWFAALRATANTDPSKLDDTPTQAREAWITWGISEGYID